MRNFLLVLTALAGLVCYDAAAVAAGGKSSYSGGSKTSSSYSGGSSRSSTYSGGSTKSSSGYSGGSTKSSSGYSGGSSKSSTYSGSSRPSTYSGSTTHTPSHTPSYTPSYSGGSTKKSSSSTSKPRTVESSDSPSGGWIFTIPVWDSKEKSHGSSGGSAAPRAPPRPLTPEEIAANEHTKAVFLNFLMWAFIVLVVVVIGLSTLSWLQSRD